MKYVISFDISGDRIRNRAVKILSEYAYRVQKSVFEGLMSKDTVAELEKKLGSIIDEKSDSVRIYPLCKKCETEVKINGTGIKIEKVDYIII